MNLTFAIDTSNIAAAVNLPPIGLPSPRKQLANDSWQARRELGMMRGRYDAAQTSDEFKNYWAATDAFDADSAHSREVRHTLIHRSRYEIGSNGYSDGIAQTYCTDLVGIGPTLRMQSGSTGFNQLVERTWQAWAKSVKFRRKLWCMAHAKHSDGESINVLRLNPRVKHPIRLDIRMYEAEQCQTPYIPYDRPNYIDGIEFDEFGNPLYYDILQRHPGSSGPFALNETPERVPADRVLHWFKLRRPGQHRAVPEMASTLNLGAAARRFREANLSTAEKVAAWTLFLKTMFDPGAEELDGVAAMSTLDIVHGMMTALPNSVEPIQLKAEHPAPAYESFNKSLINEQARPKSMPFNKAACDSSSYNYASGRLDHQTYYGSLDVDREDCNDLVLEPCFDVWFDLAIATFGWLGGIPEAVGPSARLHTWDWPKHRVADVKTEADANETKLMSGQISLARLYSDSGVDIEDELVEMAKTFGISVDEMRQRLLDIIFPEPQQVQSPAPQRDPETAMAATLKRVNGYAVNGHGAKHEN